MIQLFKREILPLQKEIHLHQHKSEHLSNQHVVQIKWPKLLVQFSITRMTKRDIMISFGIGGGNMLEHHSHFLIHLIIASNHIVMLQVLFFFIQTNLWSFLKISGLTNRTLDSIIWSKSLECSQM